MCKNNYMCIMVAFVTYFFLFCVILNKYLLLPNISMNLSLCVVIKKSKLRIQKRKDQKTKMNVFTNSDAFLNSYFFLTLHTFTIYLNTFFIILTAYMQSLSYRDIKLM